MKRKLDQAIAHVDKVQEILVEVSSGYTDDHPEIVEQYKVTFAFFEQAKAILVSLRTTY